MTRSRDVADSQDNLGGAVAPFVAGKNKIINGDFGIWQRGTTFNGVTTGSFTADRWASLYINGTINVTQQAFPFGSAPVAGYESQYFIRMSRTSTAGISDYFGNKIEDVRTFAGQTITVSFWAKGSTSFGILTYFDQVFGSGGSGTVGSSAGSFTVTTSWQRFSFTTTIASIAGKTIGAGSNFQSVLALPIAAGNVSLDLWGLQVEAGSVATPFQTATGTIQGELAACQRYYWRTSAGSNPYAAQGFGSFGSVTDFIAQIYNPVTMRVPATSVDFSTLATNDNVSITAVSTLVLNGPSTTASNVNIVIASAAGLQFRPARLVTNNNTAGYIGFSAEL